MKLKNKKTGEIKECVVIPIDESGYPNEYQVFEKGDSLTELNEEWEDAPEEPKTFWAISWAGEPEEYDAKKTPQDLKYMAKEIGNYFGTREEAEQAVEKLKVWKRLKDKGFEIESYSIDIGDNYYKTGQIMLNLNNVMNREWDEYDRVEEIKNELDLLFGGEE